MRTEDTLVRGNIKYDVKDVIKLLLSKGSRCTQTEIFKYNESAMVNNTNGSVKSIVEWSEAAKLDGIQRKAFKIIISSFIITFFQTAVDNPNVGQDIKIKHHRHIKTLVKLTGMSKGQVIMLMLGPGGSVKSTVINLVVAYACEYCEFLNHPFTP